MANRTLKYAILGLLDQRDMTGYDLSVEFESALNEFWYAQHAQIYPELKRLLAEGMVTCTEVTSGTALKKKVYSLTDAGRADFLDWLACDDEELEHTPKNTFRLRVFFSSRMPAERRIELLEHRLTLHRERLEHLRQNQRKFDGMPAADTDAFGDYLVLMGAIMREEMNCSWLEECLRLCREA